MNEINSKNENNLKRITRTNLYQKLYSEVYSLEGFLDHRIKIL